MQHKPLVLCLSGLDPTGGAGIQADIETIFRIGARCLPVITTLTVQNSFNVLRTEPVNPALVDAQVTAIMQDMPVAAIKIGLLDHPAMIHCLGTLIVRIRQIQPDLPVIADPVLQAGGGFEFGDRDLTTAYLEQIVPHCTVLTPNTDELCLLGHSGNFDSAAISLLQKGCQNILLTGTHSDSENVNNTLYSGYDNKSLRALTQLTWSWPRLPGAYHGSGCTLAAALAAYLALGSPLGDAALNAQEFTWQSLNRALHPGKGQHLPNRGFDD